MTELIPKSFENQFGNLSESSSLAPFYLNVEESGGGRTFVVKAETSETIAKLKVRLEARGLGSKRELVISKELEDDRPLSYYDIYADSKIWVSKCKRFRIFFKVVGVITVPLVVQHHDTIASLREKAVAATQIEHDFLTEILFAGRLLDDEKELNFYHIEEDDTVIVKLNAAVRDHVLDTLDADEVRAAVTRRCGLICD